MQFERPPAAGLGLTDAANELQYPRQTRMGLAERRLQLHGPPEARLRLTLRDIEQRIAQMAVRLGVVRRMPGCPIQGLPGIGAQAPLRQSPELPEIADRGIAIEQLLRRPFDVPVTTGLHHGG